MDFPLKSRITLISEGVHLFGVSQTPQSVSFPPATVVNSVPIKRIQSCFKVSKAP